jgi:ATP adenylyltransferase
MEILWAPWRINYITGEREKGCFLCLPPDHQGPDRGRLLLFSDSLTLVMLNLYPYNNGHLLVSPRRHIPSISAALETERLALMNQAARATEIMGRILAPQGFNLGINQGRVAGGSVEDHLHIHVTPRYQGDSNYMTVLSETRVISEHILATYDRLVSAFNE